MSKRLVGGIIGCKDETSLLFLTFSVLVANTGKHTLHGDQSRSRSAEQGKITKKKVSQRTSPPPPRCSFGENKIKIP